MAQWHLKAAHQVSKCEREKFSTPTMLNSLANFRSGQKGLKLPVSVKVGSEWVWNKSVILFLHFSPSRISSCPCLCPFFVSPSAAALSSIQKQLYPSVSCSPSVSGLHTHTHTSHRWKYCQSNTHSRAKSKNEVGLGLRQGRMSTHFVPPELPAEKEAEPSRRKEVRVSETEGVEA